MKDMIDKTVSIHQPSYFAWLGLLHKISNSDCYVFMDDVQLSDSAYQNRNIFLTNTGKIKYLNINIVKKGYRDKPLRNLEISNPYWQNEHLNFLNANYRKHQYFKEVFEMIASFYEKPFKSLGEILFSNVLLTLNLFGIETKVIKQSDLSYNKDAHKGRLVIELIKAVGYTTYYSGKGATSYISEDEFTKENIKLIYQQFTHPVYPQTNSPKEFVLGLSCLDFLFNCGIDKAKNLFNKS